MKLTSRMRHCRLLFLSLLLACGPEAARADYTLAENETKTFASAAEFGTLSQNISGPVTATVIFSNSEEIKYLTGAYSGTFKFIKNGGGNIRLKHDYGAACTFTGPVEVNAGNLYVHYGSELGTGTIYLNGGGLSNGGGGWDDSFTAGLINEMHNNIVLGDGKTSYMRFQLLHGGRSVFYGNITGTGNIVWGTMTTGYSAPPGDIYLYGENTFTGSITSKSDNGGTQNFNVFSQVGLGSGDFNVESNTKVNFQKSAAGATIDRTFTQKSIRVSEGRTLEIANAGGGKVNLSTKLPSDTTKNYGTIQLTGANVNLKLDYSGITADTNAKGTIAIGADSMLTISCANGKNLYPALNLSGTGSLTVTGKGNMVRFSSANNSGFSGDVFIDSGRVYLNTGKELGTGTIYLGGTADTASIQNNSTEFDCPNDIVLVTGTTSALRPYRSATTSKFRGNITGSGNLVYGHNGYTQEPDNSQVQLFGNNTYSGTTRINQGGSAAYQISVFGEQGFGTGAMTVSNQAAITFRDSGTAAPAQKMANSSLTIASGKTLTLANERASAVSVLGTVSNSGTLTVSQGEVSFAKSITNTGTLNIKDSAALGVGAAGDTTGTELTITGGSLKLDGDLVLSVFSPADYDSLKFGGSASVSIGNDARLLIDLPDDTSALAGQTGTMNLISGLNDLSIFQNMDVLFSAPGWVGSLNANGQLIWGDVSAVPEPSAFVLLFSAAGFLLLRRKNRFQTV